MQTQSHHKRSIWVHIHHHHPVLVGRTGTDCHWIRCQLVTLHRHCWPMKHRHLVPLGSMMPSLTKTTTTMMMILETRTIAILMTMMISTMDQSIEIYLFKIDKSEMFLYKILGSILLYISTYIFRHSVCFFSAATKKSIVYKLHWMRWMQWKKKEKINVQTEKKIILVN